MLGGPPPPPVPGRCKALLQGSLQCFVCHSLHVRRVFSVLWRPGPVVHPGEGGQGFRQQPSRTGREGGPSRCASSWSGWLRFGSPLAGGL